MIDMNKVTEKANLFQSYSGFFGIKVMEVRERHVTATFVQKVKPKTNKNAFGFILMLLLFLCVGYFKKSF
jgi:TRAP-type C4-dicarboxylate transport system permease small subunit